MFQEKYSSSHQLTDMSEIEESSGSVPLNLGVPRMCQSKEWSYST